MNVLMNWQAEELSIRVAALQPEMQARAAILDQRAAYPGEDMEILAEIGVFEASLPRAVGGLGLGTEPGGGLRLLRLLHALGQGNLALGRLVEAHVNAMRLIVRYGSRDLVAEVAEIVRGGAVMALWVTDAPGGKGLAVVPESDGFRLSGGKAFCSGAGHASHAVVTARDPGGETRLLLFDLGRGETVQSLPAPLSGMRAAVTGQVSFEGRSVPSHRLFGAAGDYLQEPDFSAGAWRSCAVALGGLNHLLILLAEGLAARNRTGDPHQQARFAQALTGHETGWLWLERTGAAAEDLVDPSEEIVHRVGLARGVVERACLDGMEAVQRSLGLGAFLAGSPVERVARDLATYLRQPAVDEVQVRAAAHYLARPGHRPMGE